MKNYITEWAQIINENHKENCDDCENVNETDYPCTDGFPQSEKDICTCPDCGEKMYENINNNGAYDHFTDIFQNDGEVTVTQEDDAVYISFDASGYDSDAYAEHGFQSLKKTVAKCDETTEVYTSDEQIPELMVNEEEETPVTKQDEMTLKQFFTKAKQENAVLQVHFIKVTDNTERTAIFSNSADVGTRFEDSKTVSPKVLKTITKNHDRVFEQDVSYTGSLVTFPERITEDTPHVTQDHEAADGTKWQWRRLYIQQIIDVKYNDKVVWENNGLFNFNLVGKDGKIRTTISRDEFDKNNAGIEKYNRERERRDAKFRALRKKAVEVASGLTEEQCSVDIGYAATNGFDALSDEAKIMTLAIEIKHDKLCRTNPEKHKMVDTSSNPTRGFHSQKCKGCGYSYSWDSSD